MALNHSQQFKESDSDTEPTTIVIKAEMVEEENEPVHFILRGNSFVSEEYLSSQLEMSEENCSSPGDTNAGQDKQLNTSR